MFSHRMTDMAAGDGGADWRLDIVELADMLQSVLGDNADAILIVDDDGTIRTVNPAAEELFGRLAGELVGSHFGHPMSSDGATEIDVVRQDGSRVAEMRVARTRWEGQAVNVATLRDITERRRAEERLRDFVSIASHELRTPATSIAGFASTMLDHYDTMSGDDRRRYLNIVDRQAKRLVALASDLLELARVEDGRVESYPRVLEVNAAVEAATEMVSDLVVDDVRCGDLDVYVDDEHLHEMLLNYLTNAQKYGGPPIVVEASVSGNSVDIVVVDHGEGVPPSFRPKLFERFARASTGIARQASGTGLGLSVVAALAELNGGAAWYRPNEPHGSRFGLTLPRGAQDA